MHSSASRAANGMISARRACETPNRSLMSSARNAPSASAASPGKVIIMDRSTLVPQFDRRLVLVVLVAEDADARRAEHEKAPLRGRKAEPARRQDSQDMAARKHDRRGLGRAQAGDDPIGAGAYVGRLLAIRAAVAEQEPAGALGHDFAGLAAFVVAVVPFEKVRIDLGPRAESSKLAGAPGARERAREHPVERCALKALPQAPRPALAFRAQRNVGAAGVPAAGAPFRFAVADEGDAGQHGGSIPDFAGAGGR